MPVNQAPLAPNRIVLIARGRHDEGYLDAVAYPGMAVEPKSNGNWQPHSTPGGAGVWGIAVEEALRGQDITQPLAINDNFPFRRPAKGDKYLMLLKNGQNVTRNTALMSAGDGTLMSNPGMKLQENLAASSPVTNTTAETTFSNGTYTIPANFLQVGDVLLIRGRATLTAHNGTDTHNIKIYIGSQLIAQSGAVNLAANSVVEWTLFVTVRTIGATGTIVMSGYLMQGVPGTGTPVGVILASTVLDTTVAQQVKVTTTASAASAGNVMQLDEQYISDTRSTGLNALVYADEDMNNSGGTGLGPASAAFIRVWVP